MRLCEPQVRWVNLLCVQPPRVGTYSTLLDSLPPHLSRIIQEMFMLEKGGIASISYHETGGFSQLHHHLALHPTQL